MLKRNTFRLIAAALISSALGSRTVGVQEARAMPINVRDFGATGNGTNDDGPVLNQAIAEGVRKGPGAVVFIPAGHYRLGSRARNSSANLLIDKARGVTLSGEKGTVLASTDPDGLHVLVFGRVHANPWR